VYGVSLVTPITNEVSKNTTEQTQRRGRRLCIIGFFQPLISFIYGLVIGCVSRKSYIQMMELEALDAQKVGRMRVIAILLG
jgi:putative transposase